MPPGDRLAAAAGPLHLVLTNTAADDQNVGARRPARGWCCR
jgi:hypothetical protein